MGWLTVGKEFTSPMLGNPHALAMEDMGLEQPKIAWPKRRAPAAPSDIRGWSGNPNGTNQAKLTDAVIAASNVLNSVKTDSSVMGREGKPPEVDEIDKVVLAAANSALEHQKEIGPIRMVRLGLFVDDWKQMRSLLLLKSIIDEIAKQKTGEFRSRAYDWAAEIHNTVEYERAKSTKPIPWKKIFIGVGIVGAILAALKFYASFRDREAIPVEPETGHGHEHHHPEHHHVEHRTTETPIEKAVENPTEETVTNPEKLTFQRA